MNIQIYDVLPLNDNSFYFGYKDELNELRNKIDNINPNIWKTVRWIINDYDFLVKYPIINRAYYKYWEIVNKYQLDNKNDNLVIHLCEAPGGFIQVSQKLSCKNKKKKILIDEDGFTSVVKDNSHSHINIISMSLNKDIEDYKRYNLPSYNQSILNKNVLISYGSDNTGNIINIDNIYKLNDHVKDLNKSVSIITADGGFDEGNDFNNKEQLHYSLIIHEILSMLILSNNDTHFVLKMYDTYTKTSIHMLYLLQLIFKTVYIFKPLTSRPTNSEKYIICKNLHVNEERKKSIIEQLKTLSSNIKDKKDGSYFFCLFDSLPDTFVNYITNINENIIKNQCNYLKQAIYYSSLSEENLKKFLDLNKNSLKVRKEKAFKEWSLTYNFN